MIKRSKGFYLLLVALFAIMLAMSVSAAESELEFADAITLGKAIENRREM